MLSRRYLYFKQKHLISKTRDSILLKWNTNLKGIAAPLVQRSASRGGKLLMQPGYIWRPKRECKEQFRHTFISGRSQHAMPSNSWPTPAPAQCSTQSSRCQCLPPVGRPDLPSFPARDGWLRESSSTARSTSSLLILPSLSPGTSSLPPEINIRLVLGRGMSFPLDIQAKWHNEKKLREKLS